MLPGESVIATADWEGMPLKGREGIVIAGYSRQFHSPRVAVYWPHLAKMGRGHSCNGRITENGGLGGWVVSPSILVRANASPFEKSLHAYISSELDSDSLHS